MQSTSLLLSLCDARLLLLLHLQNMRAPVLLLLSPCAKQREAGVLQSSGVAICIYSAVLSIARRSLPFSSASLLRFLLLCIAREERIRGCSFYL